MTIAHVKDAPWSSCGNVVSNNMTPQEILKRIGCDWELGFRDLLIDDGKNGLKPWGTGHRGLVRLSDNKQFDIVGSRWKIVQNAEAMDFFSKFVKAGKMKMYAAGSLAGGRRIWALASINEEANVGGTGKQSDKLQGYVLISIPHVLGQAMVFKSMAVRIRCWNTLPRLLRSNERFNGKLFRFPHSTVWDNTTKERAEACLGLATKHFHDFTEQAQLLAKAKVTPEQTLEYFCDVYEATPQGANWDRKEAVKEEIYPDVIDKFQTALLKAPGQDVSSARGTMWGAFNAITYVSDHEYGKSEDTRLHTSWFGPKAGMKLKALDIAVEKAKVII